LTGPELVDEDGPLRPGRADASLVGGAPTVLRSGSDRRTREWEQRSLASRRNEERAERFATSTENGVTCGISHLSLVLDSDGLLAWLVDQLRLFATVSWYEARGKPAGDVAVMRRCQAGLACATEWMSSGKRLLIGKTYDGGAGDSFCPLSAATNRPRPLIGPRGRVHQARRRSLSASSASTGRGLEVLRLAPDDGDDIRLSESSSSRREWRPLQPRPGCENSWLQAITFIRRRCDLRPPQPPTLRDQTPSVAGHVITDRHAAIRRRARDVVPRRQDMRALPESVPGQVRRRPEV